jgi:hypothetical protein
MSTPTSRVWLKGDDTPFSVGAPAADVADAIEHGRDNAVELVRLVTDDGRPLFVDPHHVGAVLEAMADAPAARGCGFAVEAR